MPKCKAQQVMMDLYRCDIDQLNNLELLKTVVTTALSEGNINCPEYLCTNDEASGNFTIVAITTGAHLTLHSYPEQGFLALDIFSCLPDNNPEKIALVIKGKLNPDSSKFTYIQRGTSSTDMKPRRKSQTKALRRVKKAGAKVLQVFQKRK